MEALYRRDGSALQVALFRQIDNPIVIGDKMRRETRTIDVVEHAISEFAVVEAADLTAIVEIVQPSPKRVQVGRPRLRSQAAYAPNGLLGLRVLH